MRKNDNYYRWMKMGLVAWLVLYAVVGVAAERLPAQEVYPFFSWRLFDEIPNQLTYYTIRITMYDGRKLPEPVWFADAGDMLRENNIYSAGYHHLANRIGLVFEGGDLTEVASLREDLEAAFSRPISYDLVYITIDPLAFMRTREVIDMRYVTSFAMNL
jgi:hypothetical protein